ncbi:isopentenyl-diphosphate delta-isomerase [Endozoicomonas montiporae]|uniref:Isopentenyl-diphosphate delta-isomerase n=1 Tax=Endozoicomonas montiporae CL-33 TaxID=570277 RepID=A0A142BEN8_9GAMM|nr:isopentenyl-diphosphate delta-isomerase [Endozoicomonas montiporae]AMO57214.1 isopentenyl-diphosphate delta-isomerase [Endozoicomonas montiporae CL-33]
MPASFPEQENTLKHYLDSHADDQQQADLMGELLIRVTAGDEVTGSVSKYHAHVGTGVLHRAFSVLLFNEQGQLLIQKRSADKITFPGYWANTCCSHPLYSEDELETDGSAGVKRAAIRKLAQELGIRDELVEGDFTAMTRLHYRAESGNGWVEEELDHILIARASVTLALNANEVESVRWVSRDELAELLLSQEVLVAPWFRIIAEQLLPGWWPHIQDQKALEQLADQRIIRV